MIVFKDVFTDDELFSDANKPKDTEDGLCFQFETQFRQFKVGESVTLAGANPSAEEEEEVESEAETVSAFDFVHGHRLSEYPVDKKTAQKYFKEYFKKILETMESRGDSAEDIAAFKPKMQERVKQILTDFDNYTFYKGEADTMLPTCVMVRWNDDGKSGVAYAFKCGIKQEKY